MPEEMIQNVSAKRVTMSAAVKTSLAKLSTPEAIEVMGHMQELAGDNNNYQNNQAQKELQGLSKEELMKKAESVPADVLRNAMISAGILL